MRRFGPADLSRETTLARNLLTPKCPSLKFMSL